MLSAAALFSGTVSREEGGGSSRVLIRPTSFRYRSENEYAVKAGDLQRVRIPPGQSVARPEATRAIEEVTNLLKYSGVTGHLG